MHGSEKARESGENVKDCAQTWASFYRLHRSGREQTDRVTTVGTDGAHSVIAAERIYPV